MPDMNDSEIRKLFLAAGHEQPGRDLTDRILSRVAIARIAEPTVVPPLIGKWGWACISSAAVLISLATFLSSGTSAIIPAQPYLNSVSAWLSQVRLPDGPWPQWVIGGSLLALFFAVLMQRIDRGVRA